MGICLGMQIALIEYARDVAGMAGANSTEFDLDTDFPVVALIDEWVNHDGKVEKRDENSNLGGTMRLGGQQCDLVPESLAAKIYGNHEIVERHRHRYEVNNYYIQRLEQAGLTISGRPPATRNWWKPLSWPITAGSSPASSTRNSPRLRATATRCSSPT